MKRLNGALLAASLLVGSPALAQKAPRRSVLVSIVRPAGSALDLPLVTRMEEQLASRKVSVLRVEALRARIAKLAAKRPSRAPMELAAARALELEARFTEAAERYAAAVRALEDDPRTIAEPRTIADVELARGAAALQDGDEATALAAMQKALGWVEDLHADPTFSPEARAALERARVLGATPPGLPSREALDLVTRAAGARFTLCVMVGGTADNRTLRTYVTEHGRVLLDERRSISGHRADRAALDAASRVSARVSSRIRLPPPPPPFWQKPLFWSMVGGVVTLGTAITIYLTATQQADIQLTPGSLPQ